VPESAITGGEPLVDDVLPLEVEDEDDPELLLDAPLDEVVEDDDVLPLPASGLAMTGSSESEPQA